MIIFSGEYLNGERKKGKEYDNFNINDNNDNNLIYEGEYSNGKRNGYGIEYKKFRTKGDSCTGNSTKNIVIFSGEFLNGERKKEKNIIMIIS